MTEDNSRRNEQLCKRFPLLVLINNHYQFKIKSQHITNKKSLPKSLLFFFYLQKIQSNTGLRIYLRFYI